MNYKRGNEDFFNLSGSLENYLNVSVDVKALGVLPDNSRIDPVTNSLSDKQFLENYRAAAETTLIKSTIIYKCHKGLPLSGPEKQYA